MTDTSRTAELRDTDVNDVELSLRLSRLWGTRATLMGYLTTVDHKVVGRRYIVTAFVFLFLGGLDAVVMRHRLNGEPL